MTRSEALQSFRSWTRALAVAAIALFLAKAAFESLAGQTLFAGELPDGVRVVPLVHLLGGMAGAAHLIKRPSPELRTMNR